MLNRFFYEIDIDVLFNGASCKNVQVDFEKPTTCADIRCEYTDTKILVEIPAGCKECVYANIRCTDDDCLICDETQRVKICPCTTPSDCSDCETCDGNMCVSICKDNEFCDVENDRCIECDETHPCPNNQVCNSGKCECPVDKPILNEKGECVACDDQHPCPPCTYCTPDGCKPKVCSTGVCDPSTGDCVGCLSSGDCLGENECCQPDKTCDCCPGFERDYATGKCIPKGECETDNDCKACEICDDKLCVPRECPKGYIPVEIDGVCECKLECDCAEATCSTTKACVSAGNGKCYCKECTGTCSDSDDCGEGCICGNDANCKPNPCKGSCENGTDCGPGCGCDETTNECIPCADKKCPGTDCEKILGCGCTGTGCNDLTGCDGTCSNPYECGPGCTCYKGRCVNCADFSCTNGDCANMPGCDCQSNNTCAGDGGDDECTDTFELTKDEVNCDLVATLTKEYGCACSQLTLANKLSSVTTDSQNYFFNILVEVRKGAVNSFSAVDTLPLLGNVSVGNIAENEKPLSGIVSVTTRTTYREYDIDGRFVGFSMGPETTYTASMINKDQVTVLGVKIPIPGTSISQFLFVEKVEVTVKQSTDFVFANNCTYDAVEIINSFTVDRFSPVEDILAGNNAKKVVFGGFTTIESDNDRYPMFIWYKSADDNYDDADIFRKLYVPANGSGNFVDTLYGMGEINPDGKFPLSDPEGELWSNRYYSIKNDCACDKDADLGKLTFCNPTELNYDLDACNNEITLLQPFTPCDVNQDITQWENGSYDIPNDVQTEYKLYLNGTLAGTFVHNKNLGMVKKGTSDSMFDTYSIGTPITKIELKINHDSSDECTLTYFPTVPDAIDVVKSVNCDIVGPNYQVTINKTGTGYVIDELSVSAGSFVNSTGSFILTLPKAQTVVLTYTFDNGCTKQESINHDCCEEFDVSLMANDVTCGGSLNLSYVVNTGGQTPHSVTYTDPNGVTTAAPLGTLTYTSPVSGVYRVTVTDANGCVAAATRTVDVNDAPTVVASGYSNICPGSTTNITLTVSASGIGGKLYYTANGSPSFVIVPGTGLVTLGPIATASTYVIDRIEVAGCSYNIGQVINISVLDEVNIGYSVNSTSICNGGDVIFNFTGGVEGEDIHIKAGGVKVWSGTFDGAGLAQATLTPPSTVQYTIDSDSALECLGGLPQTTTITVVAGATISLVSEVCNESLTTKTMTFNNADSAVDQDGVNIPVVANAIDVDPNLVSTVTIQYNDGSCVVSESFNVTGCDCPTATITLDNKVINLGDSVVLTPVVSGATLPLSYLWSTGETTASINVSPTTTTTYTLIVTSDTNGCSYNASVTVKVVDCDGGLDAINYISCSCDGPNCSLRFTPTFLLDYVNCKIDEANTSITANVQGVGVVNVDIGNLTKLDFFVPLNGQVTCPNPDDITFNGTITFLDETGEACCNGLTLDIIGEVVGRPGGGWECTGCTP